MSFSDPSINCPHNVVKTDPDTGEVYCIKCGDVVELPRMDDEYDND